MDVVNVDLRRGETKTPESLSKNPSGTIPVLALADGACIAENVAICHYLERLGSYPELVR